MTNFIWMSGGTQHIERGRSPALAAVELDSPVKEPPRP